MPADETGSADLILHNANVITMNPDMPRAGTVLIKGDRIAAVLGHRDPGRFKNRHTEMINCEGGTVMPGFIDAHCHLAAYAEALVSVDLSPQGGVSSLTDVLERIRSFCSDRPPGTWARGKGYNEFYLAEHRHPNRHDIDAAAPAHPVKLTHRSGHAHVLNSLALKLLGITAETADPPYGIIDRDLNTGEPTGILYGMSPYLAAGIPPLDEDEMEAGVRLAGNRLLSLGITSIQDATAHNDLRRFRAFEKWIEKGLFRPRVMMMLGFNGFEEWENEPFTSSLDSLRLRTGPVKIIIDEITGSLHPSRDQLNCQVLAIHETGLQVALHAVEEPTVEAACTAIEHVLRRHPRPDHRHRIEHCSVCPPSLAKRIRSLGIMVVTQPSFIYYSGDRYLKTVPPDQLAHLYPVASLAKQGIRVAAGSDFPIASPNPFAGVYASVARLTMGGRSLGTGETLSRSEALRLYTEGAASAVFEEHCKGSITPGKLADLVILNADPLAAGADLIRGIEVEKTIIGGKLVWSRSCSDSDPNFGSTI